MSTETETNKALVRRCWEQTHIYRNAAIVDQLCEPAYGARLKQWVHDIHAAFPDLQWTLEDLIGEGDRVVVRYGARGTHQAPWQVYGGLGTIPATGREITPTGTIIYRVENGRIVQECASVDPLRPLLQLGAKLQLPGASRSRQQARATTG